MPFFANVQSKLLEILPPKRVLTDGWPRIYRDVDSTPGRTLPPDCISYYLCLKPYATDERARFPQDGTTIVMFRLNGGFSVCTYTCVANIDREVAEGKLEQVPNGLRMLIELEP